MPGSWTTPGRDVQILWWGPELTQIYDDGYKPSFGTNGRDIAALGAKGREHWHEIWPIVGPPIEAVLECGEEATGEISVIVS